MRILSRSTLRDFWESHPDVEEALKTWYYEASHADWQSPADVKTSHRNASIIANNPVVFNIKGNSYRLIVAIRYDIGIILIRFIGTHVEYDKVDAEIVAHRGRCMELRQIRNETDYREVLREIELLFNAAPNTPECDRLDVLSTLVEAYEKKHIPIAIPDPIEAIHYYMDTRGWSRIDLELCLGSRARVSEVLSRKRSLTLEMIGKLNQELGIPAEILIQPYESVKIPA